MNRVHSSERRGAGFAELLESPSREACREGQVIHAKTTASSGSRFTAIEKEVNLPSGTSSPQHSTTIGPP